MFTITNNKVYVLEDNKMFPVNISKENGIEKVGQSKDLPKTYEVYTIQEILIKFNIQENKRGGLVYDNRRRTTKRNANRNS